jgi:hypothetical protein
MKQGHVCHHYLVEYDQPRKVLRTCVDSITFRATDDGLGIKPDDRHANGAIFDLGLKAKEKALIMAINMTYCTNDTNQDVELVFTQLFDNDEAKTGGGGGGEENKEGVCNGQHPDVSGQVRFFVSRAANGEIHGADRLLYEPNFTNLGFPAIHYVGLEHSILNARSTAVTYHKAPDPDFEVFKRSDHLIVFILENKTHFKDKRGKPSIGKHDIIMLPDNDYYMVSKRALKTVRDFFESDVFTLFRYTTHNHLSLAWKPVKKTDGDLPTELLTPMERERKTDGSAVIVLFLEVNYIVIEPEMHRYASIIKDLKV